MTKRKQKKTILFTASEAVPFCKSGGLADVCGALPKTLKQFGHDIMIVLPRYGCVDKDKHNIELALAPMGVPIGGSVLWCGVYRTEIDGLPVYFIEHDNFFGRSGLYDDGKHEYYDNAERYGFFSSACIQLCRDLNFRPDIIHCNDWQTALIPAYLKTTAKNDPFFRDTATVFSIHNIAYQGKFDSAYYPFLGLGGDNFVPDIFEDSGSVNFMKGAVFYSDCINTVSPSYAGEILSEPGGNGISIFLNRRRDDLFGILNGVDYDHWNPETDSLIPVNYSASDLSGKALCKKHLQREFMLEENPGIPVIGIVSRFVRQKGLHLLAPIIKNIMRDMIVQFVFLGSGEKRMEDFFGGLPAEFPGAIGAWIGYNERKAHMIEAGADFFLMPSLYEPCGLNQVYSMKYGTLPIVRDTGGLKDTVRQYNEKDGTGTGFIFHDLNPWAVYYTTGWAVSTYYDRPGHMKRMKRQAMKAHFSWVDSAREYEKLYEQALFRRKNWI
ncbi:MAG: glycogen/starch synthase [Candidatus Omnitrophota bacterium]